MANQQKPESLNDTFQALLSQRGRDSIDHLEAALLESIGLRMLSEHLIPVQMQRLSLELHTAITHRDTALKVTLKGQLEELLAAQRQAQEIQKLIASEAGRIYQALQAIITVERDFEFMKIIGKAMRDFPLLVHGADELYEPLLETWAMAADKVRRDAKDIVMKRGLLKDMDERTRANHFSHSMDAVRKNENPSPAFALESLYSSILNDPAIFKAMLFGKALMGEADWRSEQQAERVIEEYDSLLNKMMATINALCEARTRIRGYEEGI